MRGKIPQKVGKAYNELFNLDPEKYRYRNRHNRRGYNLNLKKL